MKVCGLQKTTLLDFPGHVAATVFLGGCNFRCPFCHNSGLIGSEAKSEYSKEELLNFLSRRKGILEGVCITGGEPTLSEDLESFIRNIRELGYLIKLDTNGYRPDVLKRLAANGLLDYVAMDIKAGRDNYSAAAGVKDIKISEIEESAEFLLEGSVPYEFRTTAVKGIHSIRDFMDIGEWLAGCSHYYLQNYADSGQVLCSGFQPFSKGELDQFFNVLKPLIPNALLRGIDN
ncbi:anaerobic ribonucleoside-triphosphate reductase activating protein [Lacrimispora saccharolytica]|uniref:Anaerobic ribonucleoside-triphosphate reductase activating protein n=1 Tax=Lacrimispora saccharolytica (strain ATCC 35040 / DSM 2544 / NRCC 2533 / WM1) TaxID=610130 RepID=D9R1S3_LACSW|nr:anaerobic ribonucleoside-triphosphate reductase activating protein [Lacrimispora saccharolytica]ADL02814.1 anaerobic ribonucleoside-triphosphate reductase activating protein [[Clostridium] saccharolyticum WM1]QRV18977.1 anaerobic ribonucleoside-triphosphate reductase activating protein [Lacrimispora saccharolytica]